MASTVQNIPVPDPPDVNDVPKDLRKIAEYVGPKVLTNYATRAQRDAAWPNPVNFQECWVGDSSYAQKFVYLNSEWNSVGQVPTGSVLPFAGPGAPPGGWILCDGRTLTTAAYPELFAMIGWTYGGSGGTFRVPDLRGRTPVGALASSSYVGAPGATGGAYTHTLTAAEMPSHTHTASTTTAGAHTHTGTATSAGAHTHSGGALTAGDHTHSGSSAVSAGAHNHGGQSGAGYVYGDSRRVYQAAGAGITASYFVGTGGTTYTTVNDGGVMPGGWHQHAIGSDGAHTHSVSVPTSGAHTHTLSIASDGAHTHPVTTVSAGDHTHPVTVNSTGSGGAHNNMQPFIALNYIIKT